MAMDDACGYVTLWIHLVLLNYALLNGWDDNLVLCDFTVIRKAGGKYLVKGINFLNLFYVNVFRALPKYPHLLS
jgi:hypothetical protein